MAPKHRATARRLFAKLPLVLFGFLIGATIAEVGLRLAGYSYPDFYTLDESRGYTLRPGMQGWYRKEGEAYVRINSDGLRDREHLKAKPPHTIRIAVIGDSYPEAFQVPVEESFWAVMEKKLQQCDAFPGNNIEVLNFGVSGYGTAQELITLREHVWAYSPDIVMLTITTNNDISDNSRTLKKTDDVPYFIQRNGKLVLDDSFKTSGRFVLRQSKINRFGRWIRDHSRLVQAVNQAHHGFKILLASWRSRLKKPAAVPQTVALEKSDVFARSEELGIDNVVYLEPTDPIWNDAWEVTEELIVTMRDEVRSKGAGFLVVTLSNGPQVFPDPRLRQDFIERFGVTDLYYPDKRLKALCEHEVIPVLTLAPALQAYAEQNKVFLHGFGQNLGAGHWNATGHRIAGELIAQKLCQGVLLK